MELMRSHLTGKPEATDSTQKQKASGCAPSSSCWICLISVVWFSFNPSHLMLASLGLPQILLKWMWDNNPPFLRSGVEPPLCICAAEKHIVLPKKEKRNILNVDEKHVHRHGSHLKQFASGKKSFSQVLTSNLLAHSALTLPKQLIYAPN